MELDIIHNLSRNTYGFRISVGVLTLCGIPNGVGAPWAGFRCEGEEEVKILDQTRTPLLRQDNLQIP